ncbi:MAG: ribonuclease R [Ferruginibacter sp.]|nr:ribonuclease R [Cytophagales bacterium]
MPILNRQACARCGEPVLNPTQVKKNKEKNPTSSPEQALNHSILLGQISQVFQENPDQSFSLAQLLRHLDVTNRRTKLQVAAALDALEEDRQLVRLDNGQYTADQETPHSVGRFDYVNSRFGFVVLEKNENGGSQDEAKRPDVWVDASRVGSAQDGDRVKVSVFPAGKSGRPEGTITEVLERKRTDFVGKIQILPRYAFVTPDHKRMYQDIYVRQDRIREAKNGDKVIVRVTSWGEGESKAEGEVVEVLGRAGANETEMHAILAEFGLPIRFPAEVLEEAREIKDVIAGQDLEKRRDFRSVTTFTIDPEDAKDFDDAISVRPLADGPGGERHWEIGVHIADVTHYVQPGSLLEKEAYQRATSVYLVDRVVPMLPEKLSNELCSLRPHEDKLTFSAVFEMNEEGKVLNEWFGRTVIHSDRRFSYEQAQRVIESGGAESQPDDFSREVLLLNQLAFRLREERFRRGAISFETVEVKFKLDEKGAPLAVYPKVRQDAHKLIEEFMLLANRKVAEFVFRLRRGKESDTERKNTMVYRIHEAPDLDKMQTFSTFVKRFGYTLKVDEKSVAGSLNQLIDDLAGKPEQNVLQSLAIRTMAKARYSTAETGHFGLAFAHYTHFTSPIRRYPDMMAHRLLQHYLDGGASAEREAYEARCKQSSEMEKLAADAERASIKYKQVEYMQTMEDREFEGIVTGLTEFGIFVEIIETNCEGLVRMTDLTDDFYELDKDNYRIVGTRTGRIIGFGDTLKVKVKDTNLEKRSIDLKLVGQKNARAAYDGREGSRGRGGRSSAGRSRDSSAPKRGRRR